MKHKIESIDNIVTNGNDKHIVKLFNKGIEGIAKDASFFNAKVVFKTNTLLVMLIIDSVAAKELGPYWALSSDHIFKNYVGDGKQFYIYDFDADVIENSFFGVTLHRNGNVISYDLFLKHRGLDVQKMEWFKHLQS